MISFNAILLSTFLFSLLPNCQCFRHRLRHLGRFQLQSHSRVSQQTNDDVLVDNYCLTTGTETFIDALSEYRPLLPTELELTLGRLSSLKKLATEQQWPGASSKVDRAAVDRALAWNDQPRTEEDVKNVLEKFRKTILGLEKYRINNPARVATLYCELIKLCLAVPDCWGAAANALEYAGLVLRDHVIERPRSGEGDGVVSHPILDVTSLWTTACMRLLDIDLGTTASQSPPSGEDASKLGSTDRASAIPSAVTAAAVSERTGTWDQKYFSQIEMSDEGRVAIRDMMLCILRVATRLLLAREADRATATAATAGPGGGSGSGSATDNRGGPLGMIDLAVEYAMTDSNALLPPASAVKLVLSLDFQLLNEIGPEDADEEDEGDEGLLAYLGTDGEGGPLRDLDEVSWFRCCDRDCTAYPVEGSKDVFQDFLPDE